MIDIKKTIELIKINLKPWPEGEKGLQQRTHREMVGGLWDEMGEMQFNFLLSQGLAPEHKLLDIGCGCLRAGRFFIDYLNSENYYGVDKQKELLSAGKKEVGNSVLETKKPMLIISDQFKFNELKVIPDFAIAQSLFTHLRSNDIILCLRQLKKISKPSTQFYCTFFESEKKVINILSSHSSRKFDYTKKQIISFGDKTGWKTDYIGDWEHPRKQIMVRYYL